MKYKFLTMVPALALASSALGQHVPATNNELSARPARSIGGPAFGQAAASLITSDPSVTSSGTHQFSYGGQLLDLNLCTYEICRLDRDGQLKVEPVAAGSTSAIIFQASKPDSKNYLVFYPAGQERDPAARRILRNQYLIQLAEGANLEEVQSRLGIGSVERFQNDPNLIICEEETAGRALAQINQVGNDPAVILVEPIFTRKRYKRAIPTDPFYDAVGTPESPARDDGNYQWYLKNTGENGGVAGFDINVEPIFQSNRATGDGVTVAVVDDGLSTDHADLAANAGTGPHFSVFAINPDSPEASDPTTLNDAANHGTNVAGLIGAVANNMEGISGVAPEVNLSGIRLLENDQIASDISDLQESRALGFANDEIDIYNNSWGPSDATSNFEAPGTLTLAALRNGALNGRPVAPDGGGDAIPRGNIFVWSGGGGAEVGDNSNYDGYANSIYTIAVGALTDGGVNPSYSEPGANLIVVAPSNGGSQEILTTSFGLGVDDDDNPIRTSEYVTNFGGTSASAALVSGVVALMLESDPTLSWREVQDILIRTAKVVDLDGGGWLADGNGAGLNFSHQYGAGLVDANAAVQEVFLRKSNSDGPSRFEGEQVIQVGSKFFDPRVEGEDSGIVPDGSGGSYITRFNMAEDAAGNPMTNLRVEHVQLQTRIVTASRSDLDIVLISPNGTQSTLQTPNPDNNEQSIVNWTFSTVRNWGEGSAGTWVLRVTDSVTGNPAQVNFANLIISGSEDAEAPVSQGPLVTSALFIPGNQGAPLSYLLDTLGADTISVGELPPGLVFDSATNVISGTPTRPGLYTIRVVLEGGGEQRDIGISVVIRPTSAALGDAVGLPDVPAIFGGVRPWDFERDDTNDPITLPDDERLAARSGANLRDNESSIFGFNGLPGGVIMFDWRTSSEEGADRLWFNRGGDVPQFWDAFISGERAWGTTAIPLNGTTNSVRWIYSKNGAETVGEDRGLVDNVRIIARDKYLEDVFRAANISGFETFSLNSRAWFMPIESLFGSESEEGGVKELLRSPTIGNGQTASIRATVVGPGNLNFVARNFADPTDVAEFVLDGVVLESKGGTAVGAPSVIQPDIEIGAGRHIIEIRFRKDFDTSTAPEISGSRFFDGITLDDLIFTPTANFSKFSAQLGTGTNSGMDHDNDSYDNLTEYAFGGNLLKSDIPQFLPRVIDSGDSRFIEFGIDQSKTDLKYVAQQSSDLENWYEADFQTLNRTESVSINHGNGPIEAEVKYYRIPVFNSPDRRHLFYRVVAKAK